VAKKGHNHRIFWQLDLLSHVESLHAVVFCSRADDEPVVVEDVDLLEAVSLAHVVVIVVVRGRDLDRASYKVHFDVVVGDDCHFAIGDEWMDKLFTDKIGIALVHWMHSDSDVTEHRFNTSSRDSDAPAIFELVRKADDHTEFNLFSISRNSEQRSSIKLFLVDFDVGNCGFVWPIKDNGRWICFSRMPFERDIL
jgi:hypothetical protein